VFYAATAGIIGDTKIKVTAKASEVSQITEVRYAFADFPSTNLVNSNGLPVSAFAAKANDDMTPLVHYPALQRSALVKSTRTSHNLFGLDGRLLGTNGKNASPAHSTTSVIVSPEHGARVLLNR
jgi:hypothetical protein